MRTYLFQDQQRSKNIKFINAMKPEYKPYVDALIELAISEDLGDGDHTSLCCIPATERGRMKLLCKQDGIIAGIEIAQIILSRLDPEVKVELLLKDGDRVVGVAYYFSDNAPTSSLEWDSVTMTLKNLKIKDPVFVEPITGKVFNLNLYHYSPNSPDTKYTNIPVWDSPVMIMDKSALELLSPDGDRKNLEKDFNTEM